MQGYYKLSFFSGRIVYLEINQDSVREIRPEFTEHNSGSWRHGPFFFTGIYHGGGRKTSKSFYTGEFTVGPV